MSESNCLYLLVQSSVRRRYYSCTPWLVLPVFAKASITWKFYEILTSSPVPPPLIRHELSVFLVQKEFRDWRGGSAVRNPDCSSRGPSFDSQHAQGQYQLSGTPFSRHLASSLVCGCQPCMCCTDTHIDKIPIHI